MPVSTPTLDLFLKEIGHILQAKDGAKLRDYLYLEPPLPDIYKKVALELRQSYPGTSSTNTKALTRKLESSLPAYDHENDPRTGGTCDRITIFLSSYLLFIRDVEQRDVETIFRTFRGVIKHLSTALGDTQLGELMVETVVAYCSMLSKFTRTLEKDPEQTTNLIKQESVLRAEENTVTLSGLAVESIMPIVQKCMVATRLEDIAPETGSKGRSSALIKLANICFPMCLKSGDLNSLDSLVLLVDGQSPPLSYYPLPQRATYLYHLGRYWFGYNHFDRAQVTLQQALDWTPVRYQSQRTHILTHLIAASIILGRFPSQQLWQSPEAASLQPYFEPLCRAIRDGDLPKFRSLTSTRTTDPADASTAFWLLRRKLLFPLRVRCEVLVTRQIFYMYNRLAGAGKEPGKVNNFDLVELRDLIVRLEKRAELQMPKVQHIAALKNGYESDTTGGEEEDEPSLLETEVTAVSLIAQGLMNGTVVNGMSKVTLRQVKGLNNVGFPRVWDVTRRTDDLSKVGGWRKAAK